MPVVLDEPLGPWHEEKSGLGGCVFIRGRELRADDDPFRIVGIGHILPAAIDEIAAVYDLRSTRGGIRYARERIGVRFPDIVLRLLGEAGDQLLMDQSDGATPR